MAKYTGRVIAPLALGAVVALGACKTDSSKQDTTSALNRDTSALGRDLALAGRDSTAQPQLKDVPANPPATSAPARTTPRTTRPSTPTRETPRAPTKTASGNTVTHPSTSASNSGGAVGEIAAGTTLSLTPTATVCTNTNKVGDKITATTQNAVTGSNGATIPAGSTVTLTVTNLKRS